MNTMHILKNTFYYNEMYFKIEDIYSLEFLNYISNNNDNYKSSHFFGNELYLNYYLKYEAILYFIKKNSIETILLFQTELFTANLLRDLCVKNKINLIDNSINIPLKFIKYRGYFMLFFTFIYITFRFIYLRVKEVDDSNKNIILIRDLASESKFKSFTYTKLYFDKIKSKSIYTSVLFNKRFLFLFKSLLSSFKIIKILNAEVYNNIGKYSTSFIYDFYCIRLIETLLFENVLTDFLSGSLNRNIYVGDNLDRFAFVQQKVSRKKGLKLIVIPHGIEYGFKFPNGFTGDIFYTTSEFAKNHFCQLYNSNKFVFDKDLNVTIYKREVSILQKKRKIVFFTESNEIYVNIKIIKELLDQFQCLNLKLYIKLHPNDNSNNYRGLNVNIIASLDEAVSNNFCISRKSSVLLEALYNDSYALAILMNNKDLTFFSLFPTLNAKNIVKFFNTKDLLNFIIKNNIN